MLTGTRKMRSRGFPRPITARGSSGSAKASRRAAGWKFRMKIPINLRPRTLKKLPTPKDLPAPPQSATYAPGPERG